MKVFLTSNLNHYKKVNGVKIPKEIDNTNGLVDQLKEKLDTKKGIIFIPADFQDYKKIEFYSTLLFDALKQSGITFDNYYTLDINNQTEIENMLNKSSMVFLSGGDTYQQNVYLQNINLKEKLNNYNGVILGQSAGSINLADEVYNSPECEEDLIQPIHFQGLGQTNINVEPHFEFNISIFDKDEIFHRIQILKESLTRPIYAICDTSHIFDDGSNQILYGEGYLISERNITKLASHGEKYIIHKRESKKLI